MRRRPGPGGSVAHCNRVGPAPGAPGDQIDALRRRRGGRRRSVGRACARSCRQARLTARCLPRAYFEQDEARARRLVAAGAG